MKFAMSLLMSLLMSWIMWLILITLTNRIVGTEGWEFIGVFVAVTIGQALQRLFTELIEGK